jgi:hypothetical protein
VALMLLGLVFVLASARLSVLFRTSEPVAAAIPRTALWLGALAIVGGIVAIVFAARRPAVLLALTLPLATIPAVGMRLLRAIGADRSHAALADAIRPLLTGRTEIVAVGVYPLSLPFYLGRTFTLATADGTELTSNYIARHLESLRRQPESPLRPPAWWEEALTFCTRPRLFVVPDTARVLRERIGSVLPLRGASRKVAVYGPCGGDAMARGE